MSPTSPTIAVVRSTRPHVCIHVPRSTPAARRALADALTARGLPVAEMRQDAHALRGHFEATGRSTLAILPDEEIEVALRAAVVLALPLGHARHADGRMLEALVGSGADNRGPGATLLTPRELEQCVAAGPSAHDLDRWTWHLGGAYLHGVIGEHDCDVEGSLEAVLAMTDGLAIARHLAAEAAAQGEAGAWQQALDRALQAWPAPEGATARSVIASRDPQLPRANLRPRGA